MPSMPDYKSAPSITTGANGFIGRNLIEYFNKQGWPVIALGRKEVDLNDRDAVLETFKKLPKAGRIFHLATHLRTGPALMQVPADLLDLNARMHLNVLEAWKIHQPQAKLVSPQSSCAYPVSNDPIPETALQSGPPHLSVKGYGLAKQLLIIGADLYATQHKLKSLMCFFATVYGPHDHLQQDRTHFIGGMLSRALADKAAGKKEMLVYGTPKTERECLYVTDQIEAMLAADVAFESGTVNCAANQPINLQIMAEAIQEAIDWKVPITFPPSTYTGPDRKQLDSTKFLKATGWKPRVTLPAGLRLTANDIEARQG